MKVFEDSRTILYNKSCTDMSELQDNSIQCCVTSPPYWGLRKYDGNQEVQFSDGMSSFGLEKTPELYVAHSIEILREIKRVLRPDGVCFFNLGDSYMSGGGASRHKGYTDPKYAVGRAVTFEEPQANKHNTIKPKDLCLIPFRVAIAAQEDGWWIRSDIIWNKPNPMPESVKDRPTDAYEHILMLTKSSKYYWDIEAVREKYTEPLNRWGGDTFRNSSHKYIDTFEETGDNGGIGKIGATSMFRAGRPVRPDGAGRNLRNVWTFPTQPYPESHFATFPEALPERCIKAATPEYGCCDKCGKPYERIVERIGLTSRDWQAIRGDGTKGNDELMGKQGKSIAGGRPPDPDYKTTGWQQACRCDNSKPIPSIILDSFAGSGTTLWVAKKLNRKAIGYELSSKYCKLAIDRNRQSALVIK
jgi:DNA modification methylase